MNIPQLSLDVVAVILVRFVASLISWIAASLIGEPIIKWIKARVERDKVKVAMFQHYEYDHPPKNPRVCDIGLCQLVPPKHSRSAQVAHSGPAKPE